jgi:phage/plasmid primase-like uncharacterized protein
MSLAPITVAKSAVKEQAAGRWEWIIGTLAKQFSAALSGLDRSNFHQRHHTCPIHGGKGDWRWYRDFHETGGGICSCGRYPDGISVLMAANGWGFNEALGEIDALLNGRGTILEPVPPPKQSKPIDTAKEDRKALARLKAIATGSVLLSEPIAKPAWNYFEYRGLAMPQGLARSLRFHPRLPAYDPENNFKYQGVWPAIIGILQDPLGQAVTIHRHYITPNGLKAPIGEDPKRMCSYPSYRQIEGAAIRLFPATDTVAIAEGIETALAVTELTGIPCWSSAFAYLLEKFEPPQGIRQVHVYADRDKSEAGERAAKALVKRLWERDMKAGIFLPPTALGDRKSIDWLDELVASKKAG